MAKFVKPLRIEVFQQCKVTWKGETLMERDGGKPDASPKNARAALLSLLLRPKDISVQGAYVVESNFDLILRQMWPENIGKTNSTAIVRKAVLSLRDLLFPQQTEKRGSAWTERFTDEEGKEYLTLESDGQSNLRLKVSEELVYVDLFEFKRLEISEELEDWQKALPLSFPHNFWTPINISPLLPVPEPIEKVNRELQRRAGIVKTKILEEQQKRRQANAEAEQPDLTVTAPPVSSYSFAQPPASPLAPSTTETKPWLQNYIRITAYANSEIQLPLISSQNQAVVAPMNDLRIDLPLKILQEGVRPEVVHSSLRENYVSALLVDRARRVREMPRDCDISQRLAPGSRCIVTGDPGCGKTTLLRWLAQHYAALLVTLAAGGEQAFVEYPGMPSTHDWLPILILCREIVKKGVPASIDDLLELNLEIQRFPDEDRKHLVPEFLQRLDQGRIILLVDGLDEIPDVEVRRRFCEMLDYIAIYFPLSSIVVSSRVIGFQAVRAQMEARYDQLLVAPLDTQAKQRFIERWIFHTALTDRQTEILLQKVCDSREASGLTDNIFFLAIFAQMYAEDCLHNENIQRYTRRVDVYRRAVMLMLKRRPLPVGPPLTANELLPHLEFLAYRMRQRKTMRLSEEKVHQIFRELRGVERELRRAEAYIKELERRPPEELLEACTDTVGILQIAGREEDAHGYEHNVVQFSHQTFQEFFAGRALRHGRDGSGEESAGARLRACLADIAQDERAVRTNSVKINNDLISEPIFAEQWQETLRTFIADLPQKEADDAIMLLLPDMNEADAQARARTVFALQCLVDEPDVSEATLEAVFEAVIDCLEDYDSWNRSENSILDSTLFLIAQSNFGSRLRIKLLTTFITARGKQRYNAGRCAALFSVSDNENLNAENAETIITDAVQKLESPQLTQRVQTALTLMERFYIREGLLDFLSSEQQQTLVDGLLSLLKKEEADRAAAIWALTWLTGANRRNGEMEAHRLVHLQKAQAEQVLSAIDVPGIDDSLISWGSLLLNREQNVTPVGLQRDWIYELAVIADGGKPRRALPSPISTERPDITKWLSQQLRRKLELRYSYHVAQALGAFGIYIPEMTEPLRFLFMNARQDKDKRDEAVIYLALVGTPAARATLIKAADTLSSDPEAPTDEAEFLSLKGLLGLLLLDDVKVLAAQMRKPQSSSDLAAYAYSLAGSSDPLGQELLEALRDDPNERIREAVEKAYALPWMLEAQE